jgi:hypothetical protein
MALKKVKRGDTVEVSIPEYGLKMKAVVATARDGVPGTLITLDKKGEFMTSYYEKQDLKHWKRIKISSMPKKLAERAKAFKK